MSLIFKSPKPSRFATRAGAIAVLVWALQGASAVNAQALPSGVRLGMPLAELQSDAQAASNELQRVARPERMSNGARGLWRQAQSAPDGLQFDVTYFVRGTQIDRVDMLLAASPDGPAAGFERIVRNLRAQYGAELRSHQPEGTSTYETASWIADDMDVAAYLTGPRDAEKVRVVYKRRELKDAGTL